MPIATPLKTGNGIAVSWQDIPCVPLPSFLKCITAKIRGGHRLVALTAIPSIEGLFLVCILAADRMGQIEVLRAHAADRYSAVTPECPQAHLFEREIAEQWGIVPENHPWLKPVRYHASRRPGIDAWSRRDNEPIPPGVSDYFTVSGDEIHEVAVGPVHAGIIEPGHFRFQCHGENVLHLEIALGYQHRGVEQAFIGNPGRRIHYMETLAGDTTIGHATAYCMNVEACGASHPSISMNAQLTRAIALELERLANHTGDLGALALDIGFLPTASYCGRIRGDFLNMTALLCGNRFGRGLIRPGGVAVVMEADRIKELVKRLDAAERDVTDAVNVLWNSPSVMARFEDTGAISTSVCRDLGIVGPPARASGLELDVRMDFPTGAFQFSQIPISTWSSGDVFGRAIVRWNEIQRSIHFIREQSALLDHGSWGGDVALPGAHLFCVSLVEGWRGEICHLGLTDQGGQWQAYKVIDPSFHNWMGLAMALRNQAVSDFPLCNKSFNLSYCGHDL